MTTSRFFYITYIRTTAQRLWDALTLPEHTEVYWGCRQESDWRPGAGWKMFLPDGRLGDSGKVVEIDPPRRLVLEWRNEFLPDLTAEGPSRCVIELEPMGETVRLSVLHEIDREGSKLIEAVSSGWPMILSSLKSLLETGHPLPAQPRPPKEA
ncbi:MAG TPA: SRPBCC family protein [Caulobacteraceae bacterium]|jgi:uncharacterized protein YndB with AHSA1/START domain|nr:SRPBCC family protein [Caulobacteraceae bacterium]